MSEFRPSDCPFCSLPSERILEANALGLALADAFPVSAGHALVIPRRHVVNFFQLTTEEVFAVHELICRMKQRLEDTLKPDGYNIGINVGALAGQTVGHAHIHLIPRYAGDVAEPAGGVRNIIPGRGRYPWSDSSTGMIRD